MNTKLRHDICCFGKVVITILTAMSLLVAQEPFDSEPNALLSPDHGSLPEYSHNIKTSEFNEDYLAKARIFDHIFEAVSWYIYPRNIRPIVLLYGYELREVEDYCTANSNEHLKSSRLSLGRVAKINDSTNATTSRIIARFDPTNLHRPMKSRTLFDFDLSDLCGALVEIVRSSESDNLVIAIERPFPDVKPTRKYIVRADVLFAKAARVEVHPIPQSN